MKYLISIYFADPIQVSYIIKNPSQIFCIHLSKSDLLACLLQSKGYLFVGEGAGTKFKTDFVEPGVASGWDGLAEDDLGLA